MGLFSWLFPKKEKKVVLPYSYYGPQHGRVAGGKTFEEIRRDRKDHEESETARLERIREEEQKRKRRLRDDDDSYLSRHNPVYFGGADHPVSNPSHDNNVEFGGGSFGGGGASGSWGESSSNDSSSSSSSDSGSSDCGGGGDSGGGGDD